MHWYPSGTVHIVPFVWVQMRMWTGYCRVCITGIVDIQGQMLKRYRLAHYRIPCKQVFFPVFGAISPVMDLHDRQKVFRESRPVDISQWR